MAKRVHAFLSDPTQGADQWHSQVEEWVRELRAQLDVNFDTGAVGQFHWFQALYDNIQGRQQDDHVIVLFLHDQGLMEATYEIIRDLSELAHATVYVAYANVREEHSSELHRALSTAGRHKIFEAGQQPLAVVLRILTDHILDTPANHDDHDDHDDLDDQDDQYTGDAPLHAAATIPAGSGRGEPPVDDNLRKRYGRPEDDVEHPPEFPAPNGAIDDDETHIYHQPKPHGESEPDPEQSSAAETRPSAGQPFNDIDDDDTQISDQETLHDEPEQDPERSSAAETRRSAGQPSNLFDDDATQVYDRPSLRDEPRQDPERSSAAETRRSARSDAPRPRRMTSIMNEQRERTPTVGLDQYAENIVYGYLEPQDNEYPVKNDQHSVLKGISAYPDDTWIMAGASIRGRTHQNAGTYRDDAFAMRQAGSWNIVAVSDGAGSAKYSRVTSNKSVELAVDVIASHANRHQGNDPDATQNAMRAALEDAAAQVHRAQTEITQKLTGNKRDTYCTFMVLVHHPLPDRSSIFGTLHIGDGMMMAATDEKFNPITAGQHGADASTTYFVLSFKQEELPQFIDTHYVDKPLEIFAVMTDGIEDDLKPSSEGYQRGERLEKNAEAFVRRLQHNFLAWPCTEHWGEILENVISYEQRGSRDDRTLVVLALAPPRMEGCR